MVAPPPPTARKYWRRTRCARGAVVPARLGLCRERHPPPPPPPFLNRAPPPPAKPPMASARLAQQLNSLRINTPSPSIENRSLKAIPHTTVRIDGWRRRLVSRFFPQD